MVGKAIRARHGFDLTAAESIVDRIAKLPVAVVVSILSQMPDDWLSEDIRKGLCEWWGSQKFVERLGTLRKGLADGSLL